MVDSFAEKSTRWLGSPASLVTHTILFAGVFVAGFLGIAWDEILLVLTTAVSLEAIYLAIFIQMTVNRTTQSLKAVEENIDEIQKDVDEIQEDVDEIQEDVEEIQEDDEQDDLEHGEHEKALEDIKSQISNLVVAIEKFGKIENPENKQ